MSQESTKGIRIKDIARVLEDRAPLSFQESYDNSGLQVGDPDRDVSGILISLDVTEPVLEEASQLGFNLILSHHPVIFKGLKSLTGKTATERIISRALETGIAIYSAHTNVDAWKSGVNHMLARKLGLQQARVLAPMKGNLKKLVVFVPHNYADKVRDAMFKAGAGHIGDYDSCSYNLRGEGSFRGMENSDPFVGTSGEMHFEPETRIETIVPGHLTAEVVRALELVHPYEEVAFDLYPLDNEYEGAGSGMIGELEDPLEEEVFLAFVRDRLRTPLIRHSPLLKKPVQKVALCGGAGSFLIGNALSAGADVFLSADLKYHQFFEAEGRIVLMDVGHYESEQFTRELFYDLIMKNFPKFAVRLSETNTNPIKYY